MVSDLESTTAGKVKGPIIVDGYSNVRMDQMLLQESWEDPGKTRVARRICTESGNLPVGTL